MKLFYKQVDVVEREEGFGVNLDSRAARTPARTELILANRDLAARVAQEWRDQGDKIEPVSMPITQLVNTAIDQVPDQRTKIVQDVVNYAQTDLLCYRADRPRSLVERQHRTWQPVLDWVEASLGARFEVTSGVAPVRQSDDAVAAVREAVEGHDDQRLAALHLAVGVCGSVLIALALSHGHLDAEAAYAASQLDEIANLETWGSDAQAEARLERIRRDIYAAAEVFALSRPA